MAHQFIDLRVDGWKPGVAVAAQLLVRADVLDCSQPLVALLHAAQIPAEQQAPGQWEAVDMEANVVSDAQLRQLRDTVVRLRRRGDGKRAAEDAARSSKGPRSSGGAQTAGAASREAPASGFKPEMWPCAEGINALDEKGKNLPMLNAILELADNAIRALLARHKQDAAAPLEIYLRAWCVGDAWFLSVRDTGIGMDATQIPKWGKWHESEAIVRKHADGTAARGLEEGALDNAFYANGQLHFAGVGGKTAAMAMTALNGYVDVVSRSAGSGSVCSLTLHKDTDRERKRAIMERQLLSEEQRAALPPLKDVHFLPGEIRAADDVELGQNEAADGGRWQDSGTQVTPALLNGEMVHRVGSDLSLAKLRRHLAHVFHAYIHPREAQRLNATAAPPGSRAAAAAAGLVSPPAIKIVAFGVDLATISDDLTSRILTAGGATGDDAEQNTFQLSVALVRPDGEVSHIGVRLYYNPFIDGKPTLPEDALLAAGVNPMHLIVLRAGRVLTNNEKPATIAVPQLRTVWGVENQAQKKRAREAGRFLARCTGFLAVGASSEAKSDKSKLMEDTMHDAALKVIFASCEADAEDEKKAPKLRDVKMYMLPFTGPAGAKSWQAFNVATLRSELLSFVELQHGRDREAGPFPPPRSFPLELRVDSEADRRQLKCPEAGRITGWHGIELPQGKIPAGDYEPELRVSLLLPESRRAGGGRQAGGLFTVRCFVTRGTVDDDEQRVSTGIAVLDPWFATDATRSQLVDIDGVAGAFSMNGGQTVLPMRLILNQAVLVEVDKLAETSYGFKTLSPADWKKQVEEKKLKFPARIFAVTNFRGPGDTNHLVNGVQLAHDAVLPSDWCLTILNMGKSSAALLPGSAVSANHLFVGDVKLTLTVTSAEGTGDAIDTFTKETQRYQREHVRDFGQQQGKGLYFFDPRELRSLRRPGDYKLAFSVDGGSVEGVALAPLVLMMKRLPPPVERRLDANAVWSLCCHAGQCNASQPRCLQGKRGAPLAATIGADDGMTLFVSQKDAQGNDLGFPADAWRFVKLSVWDTTDETEHDGTGRQQQLLDKITLQPVRSGDVSVSDNGLELRIDHVRITQCVLPSGDELDDTNRTGKESRGVKRSAPLRVLLRVGLQSARAVRTDDNIELLGAGEVPLAIHAGLARRIVCSPGAEALRDLTSEAQLSLDVFLADANGNATATLARGGAAASGPPVLKLSLIGLEHANARQSSDQVQCGKTLRLKVTASPGTLFSLELSGYGLPALKLSGEALQREVRLCRDDDAEQLADARLSGEAGTQLPALSEIFAHVCVAGSALPDTQFGGNLYFFATGAPAAWCTHVAGLQLQAAEGRAQLPSNMTLPLAACRITLYVLPERRAAGAMPGPAAARVEITVTPPPLARLETRAPEEEATRNADIRLVFVALSESGMQVAVPQELLDALAPSDDAVELRRSDLFGNGSAAVTVRLDGVPGTHPVRFTAPAAGDRPAVELIWQVSLIAGAPASAEFALRGEAPGAGSAFRVARGDAVPFIATFVDGDGAECAAAATDGCVAKLVHDADAVWLVPEGCAHGWHARDNAVALEGLCVSADAPLGVHVIAIHLFPAPPTGGGRGRGRAQQPAAAQAPMLQLELRLHVLVGSQPASLHLSSADPLVAEAGALLSDLGVVMVLDADDDDVPASAIAALPQLTLEIRQADTPLDPRTIISLMRVSAVPGVDGGAFDCDSAAVASLCAPIGAGDYSIVYRLDRHVQLRTLRVDGATSGRLFCSFQSAVAQLPSCVEDGAAPGQSALFAARLDIVFRDGYNNPVDLAAIMPPGAVKVRFERAHAAAGAGELPQPIKDEPVEAAEAAAEGRVTFKRLLAVPSWPSGDYRLVVDAHPELWTPPRAADSIDCSSATHPFQYLDAGAVDAERERARRAAAAESAALAALVALQTKQGEVTRAQQAARAAGNKNGTAQLISATTAAAENSARQAAAAAATAGGEARQYLDLLHAERNAPPQPPSELPSAPQHVKECRRPVHRRGSISLGNAMAADGGLAASCAGRADVLGLTCDLLRAETPSIGAAVACAVGSAGLGTLLVRNRAGRDRCVERLPATLSVLRLDHAAAQARFFRGGSEATGQRTLHLLPLDPAVPGLLGYLVNLVHLSPEHLAAEVDETPAAAPAAGRRGAPPPAPRRFSLRESVLHFFLGNRLLFDNDASMLAYAATHPLGERCLGLRSLSGAALEDGGSLERGAAAERPFELPRQATPWESVEAAPLLPGLRSALQAVRAAREAATAAAAAGREALEAEAAAQEAQEALGEAQRDEAALNAELLAAHQLWMQRRAQADALKVGGAAPMAVDGGAGAAQGGGPASAGRADPRARRR